MSERPRLRLLHPDELDAQQESLRRQILGGRRSGQPFRAGTDEGELLGPFNALLLAPGLGMAVQQLGESLRFEGSLPARLRELVILAVGADADSAYEWYAHSRVALTVGITRADLDSLADGRIPGSCDRRETAALRLCRVLPRRVPEELYSAARQHFEGAELVELGVLVGYYKLLAGVLGTFDVPAPEE